MAIAGWEERSRAAPGPPGARRAGWERMQRKGESRRTRTSGAAEGQLPRSSICGWRANEGVKIAGGIHGVTMSHHNIMQHPSFDLVSRTESAVKIEGVWIVED
jgi:hypothetical protein